MQGLSQCLTAKRVAYCSPHAGQNSMLTLGGCMISPPTMQIFISVCLSVSHEHIHRKWFWPMQLDMAPITHIESDPLEPQTHKTTTFHGHALCPPLGWGHNFSFPGSATASETSRVSKLGRCARVFQVSGCFGACR